MFRDICVNNSHVIVRDNNKHNEYLPVLTCSRHSANGYPIGNVHRCRLHTLLVPSIIGVEIWTDGPQIRHLILPLEKDFSKNNY